MERVGVRETAWFVVWGVAFLMYLGVGLAPAEASQPEIIGQLAIPSVGIESNVTKLRLENGELKTPEALVGAFQQYHGRTLLIGHQRGVFADLTKIDKGDIIEYRGEVFVVSAREIRAKDDISMNELLRGSENELILMTCAGEERGNGDATERLIVTAARQE